MSEVGQPGGPVTFAVVGCGNIARTHAEALRRLNRTDDDGAAPTAQIVAFSDVRPERAAAFAAEFGGRALSWQEVLADPSIEAVTVCTPSGTHAALGIEALEAGKHVVVEKPMDASLAEATRLAEVAERGDRVLGVISQHRFDPATEYAAQVLARGGLGRIVLVEALIPWWRAQSYYDADSWRGTWAMDGGGALINQGVHTVDLLLHLAGPVTRVQAAAATLAHDIEVEDVVTASLTFASGALGVLAATTATAPGQPARLTVYGTEGVIVIEGDSITVDERADGSAGATSAPRADALLVAGQGSRSVSLAPEEQIAWGEAHARQLADVVAVVRGGGVQRSGAREGWAALALVDAVYRSARTGEAVELG